MAIFWRFAGAYGNACLGTDIANPFYADLASLLRVRRDIMPVMRREALPALGGKFHLISAIWISFNTWFTTNPDGTSTRHHWSVEDWAFLFNDLLQNHLIYPGRIYFVLNQNYYADGSIGFDQELYDWFEGIGAQTDRAYGIVDLQLDHLRVLPPPKPRPPGATIQPESVPP